MTQRSTINTPEQLSELLSQHHRWLAGQNGAQLDCRDVHFENVVFDHVDLSGALFDKCVFTDVSFLSVTFANMTFRQCTLDTTRFENCQIDHVLFDGLTASRVSGHGIQGRNMRMLRADVEDCRLTHSQLHDARIERSVLKAMAIRSCSILETHIVHSDLRGAIFRDTSFAHSQFVSVLFDTSIWMGISFTETGFPSTDLSTLRRLTNVSFSNVHDLEVSTATISASDRTIHLTYLPEHNILSTPYLSGTLAECMADLRTQLTPNADDPDALNMQLGLIEALFTNQKQQ